MPIRRPLTAALIATTALCSVAMTAHAKEPQDKRLYGGAMVIPYVHVDDNRLEGKNAFGLQGLLGIPLDHGFNVEASTSMYRYKSGNGAGGERSFYVYTAMIDLLYTYPTERFTPFAMISAGTVIEDLLGTTASQMDPAIGLGLGAIVPITKRGTGIRGDIRYIRDGNVFGGTNEDGVSTADYRFNLGVHIPYGIAAESTAKPTDADNDGIPDYRDRCPGTPTGSLVDVWGCPMDSDGDGVGDGIDQCPGTPSGTQVNAVGCAPSADSDGDGVTDDKDRCPDTSPGLQVDASGCAIKQTIILDGVNFEFNSDKLELNAKRILSTVGNGIKGQPSMEVEIGGHTDSVGPDSYNKRLSERRAASVRDFLISEGVRGSQLTSVGYGESQPLANGNSDEDHAKNRRVELSITKQ